MAVSLSKFLYPACVEAASLLQTSDLIDLETEEVSSVLLSCIKASFTQAQIYCDTGFIKDNYIEKYNNVDLNFTLKNYPLDSINLIKVNGVELTENVDYTIEYSNITLIPTSDKLKVFIETNPYPYFTAVVDYIGGFTSIDKLPNLMEAVVLQAIVTYNRKSTLGMGSISGAGFSNSQAASISGASDKGDTLDAFNSLLDPLANINDIQDVV